MTATTPPKTSYENLGMLDRNSKVPMYHQLYELLRGKILSGEWQTGELIPSEVELMTHYGVSRITVRQAISGLVHDNLVSRQQGQGTFVSYPTFNMEAARLISFEDDMLRRGLTPSTRVLRTNFIPASQRTAEYLKIPIGSELASLQLLRLANGTPMCVEEHFIAHLRCPGILEGQDFTTEPLNSILKSRYGIRITRAEQAITAMVASESLNELLHLSNPALIYIERITYSQMNIPISFQRFYYRADRYILRQELRAP